MNGRRQPPNARYLSRAQYSGWACCWCAKPLRHGARSAGRAEGSMGAHDLSVEVYECPDCAAIPVSPATGDSP